MSLADQAIFREAEKSSVQLVGDTNFSNLFIWRSYYRPLWAQADGCLCLIARPENEEPFGLPPVGGGDRLAALEKSAQYLRQWTDRPSFRRVPEDLAQQIEGSYLPYELVHDRDNDDYVYLRQQLCSLGGRRMHQKKNHYNYFVSHYQFECLPISDELLPDLLSVQEGWLATKQERDNLSAGQFKYELESVRELLTHHRELGQWGLAIRIDGRLEAFTLGEALSQDTALVHVEKANYEIRGLYVALLSHFCRQLPEQIVYINREQDLGLEGLRQSKESLKPDHLRRKFVATAL